MSFTLTQLDKPSNPAGVVSAGGSLAENTTYHYKVIAFGGANDVIYCDLIGTPSDTVTVSTTSVNKTVTLTWDAVTGATRYLIARIVDGDSFSPQTVMFLANGGYPLVINALTYEDTGISLLKYSMYYEYGMPQITVDAGTTEDLDSMADWAVTNGYTNYFSRETDNQHLRGIFFRFTGWLVIDGTLNCATDTTTPSASYLFIDGGWKVAAGGIWNAGMEVFSQVYWQRGMNIVRTGKYSVLYLRGALNWFTSSYTDVGYIDNSYIGNTKTSHGIVRPNGTAVTVNIKRCLFPYLPLEFYDNSPVGFIDDCVWSGMGTPNPTTVVKNTTLCTSAGIYNYYVTHNVYMKGLVFKQTGTDIQFHKSGTAVDFYFVNGTFYNYPPKANKISNPENMIVYDCKTFNLQIVDINGDAIEGVTVTITDTLDNEIVMTSDSDGRAYRANGTASSGGASTLTDDSLSLAFDEVKTHLIEIISGTGSGQERVIASNTSDTFTIEGTWDTNPDDTSVYRIECFLKMNKYQGNSALPNPYCYDTTAYNPYSFKFEKSGYATTILDGFTVSSELDWTMVLKTAIAVNDPTPVFYNPHVFQG